MIVMFATEACMRQFQRSVQSPGEVRRLLRQLGLAQQVRIRRSYNAAMSSMYFLVEVAEPVGADRRPVHVDDACLDVADARERVVDVSRVNRA
jgi:hypothetical protein